MDGDHTDVTACPKCIVEYVMVDGRMMTMRMCHDPECGARPPEGEPMTGMGWICKDPNCPYTH